MIADLDIEDLTEVAASGDGEALYELSERYEFGIGVEKDLEKAMILQVMAAEKGVPNAQVLLRCVPNVRLVARWLARQAREEEGQ